MNLKSTFGAAILCCLMLASCRKDEPAKPVKPNEQTSTVDEKKDDKKKDIDGGSLTFYINKEDGLRVAYRGKDGTRIKINGSDGDPGQHAFTWKFDVIPEVLELVSVNDAGRTFNCRIPINEITVGLYARELQVSTSEDVSLELPPFLQRSSDKNWTLLFYHAKPGAFRATDDSYYAVKDSRIVFAANHIKRYQTNDYLDATLRFTFYHTAKTSDADGDIKINFHVSCRESFRLKVAG